MDNPNPAPVEPPVPPVDPAPPQNDPPPANPPAGDPPAPTPTASDPPPAEDKAGNWPDDWRERLAGDDEAFLRHLKRYSSPQTFAKGFKEREDLIRSGKLKRDMPDPSDEKAFAEWRKEQGIPDDPTGYTLTEDLTKRLVDEDKPVLANFTEFAHKNHMPPAFVQKAGEWYVEMSEQAATKQAADDEAAVQKAEDTLRADWGREYRTNMKLAERFAESIPGGGKDWHKARLPNGRTLGSDPEFVLWLADMGRERFGDSVFASSDSEKRFTDRRTEIEKIMKTDMDKYWAEGLDKEYGEILEREAKRRK